MSQVTNKRGPVGSHRNGATEWQGEPCRMCRRRRKAKPNRQRGEELGMALTQDIRQAVRG